MLGRPAPELAGALAGLGRDAVSYVGRWGVHGRDCTRDVPERRKPVSNNALGAVFLICVTVLVALGMACCTLAR